MFICVVFGRECFKRPLERFYRRNYISPVLIAQPKLPPVSLDLSTSGARDEIKGAKFVNVVVVIPKRITEMLDQIGN